MTRKSKSVPKYVEIREDIKFKILGGEWSPGDKILSEEEYCDIYGVSRITIRKAITDLENEGLLAKQSGRGTFITEWSEAGKAASEKIMSFTNDMKERGKKPVSLEVTLDVVRADRQMAGFLDVKPGDKMIQLRRVRAVDNNEIIAFSINSFPLRDEFSLDADDYYGSLYEYFEGLGIHCQAFKEYAEAQLPEPEVARKLEIASSEPVLKIVKLSHNSLGTFKEYNVCYYVGSKYRLYVKT